MDKRARTIQTRSAPPDVGTKHLVATYFGADGARDSLTIEDISGTRSWQSLTREFDALGQVTSQRYVDDNGDVRSAAFAYDAQGNKTQSVHTWANGDIVTSLFGLDGQRDSLRIEDISDTRSWTSRTRTYDDNGDVITTEFVRDVL